MEQKMKRLGVGSLKELFGWIAVANAEYVSYRDNLSDEALGSLIVENFSNARRAWGEATDETRDGILNCALELCALYDAQELTILINSARELAALQDLRAYGSQHLN